MNQPVYTRRPVDNSAIPNVIFALLVINGLGFAAQNFLSSSYTGYFALWPTSTEVFRPWQLVSYAFMHGNFTHIFFNMLMLWMFGRDLERMMGPQRFFTYYMVCVVGAGLVQLVVAEVQGGIYPTVGASGGVFGILLAYGLAFPNRTLMLIFPPIPIKAKYFVILLGLFELYVGFSGRAPGIANFAHLGGMLFGFLLLRYWARRRRG